VYSISTGFQPGYHKVRFCIGDASLFCRNTPADPTKTGVIPWDTTEWWIDVPQPCASLSGECPMPSMETDQKLD
jgi:hypothetical protein